MDVTSTFESAGKSCVRRNLPAHWAPPGGYAVGPFAPRGPAEGLSLQTIPAARGQEEPLKDFLRVSHVDRLRRCTRRPCTAASYIAAHPRPARGVRQSETGTRIRVIFAAGSGHRERDQPRDHPRSRHPRRGPARARVRPRRARRRHVCPDRGPARNLLAWARPVAHRRAVSSPATCATPRRKHSEYRGRSAPPRPAGLPARRPGRDRTRRPSAGAAGPPTSARSPRRAATSARVPRSPRR